MKLGRTLTELAAEIERQTASKRDFVADTRKLAFHSNGSTKIQVDGIEGAWELTEHAHGQIADRIGVPKKYYDRMRSEAPHLLDENVNHWFAANPEKRMLRTLDNKARAFLSDRYRPLDNFDLAEAVLPILAEQGIKVESCEITPIRMYIKAVNPKIEAEVKKGDVVQAGIVISNSEIGAGSLRVEPLINRLVCLNGMISQDHAMKKYHVGRQNDGSEESSWEFFRDETRATSDRAFWMKVQDTTRQALGEALFQQIVEKMRESTEKIITGDPVKVIEVISNKYQLTEGERGGVLRHLIQGSDLSLYGVVNAITRQSQDIEDYDRATDFEKLGGQVLELPKSDWKLINEQAAA